MGQHGSFVPSLVAQPPLPKKPVAWLCRVEGTAAVAVGEVGAGQSSLWKQVQGALYSGRGGPQEHVAPAPGRAGVWQQCS